MTIKEFVKNWTGKGSEKSHSQTFWLNLLQVLGIENPYSYIDFEQEVMLDNTSYIDGFIDATKVLIEQKSINKSLTSGVKQSDGSVLKPFQQALRYNNEQSYSRKARYIITCNFKEFNIYDMENPKGEPTILFLENLEKESYKLNFLIKQDDTHLKVEQEISLKAGDFVSQLYNATIKQYTEADQDNPKVLESLNMFCIRIVFCLYADDSKLFPSYLFHNYLRGFSVKDTRRALLDLFEILNTPISQRDEYLEDNLLQFPYVNGGLFADTSIVLPKLNEEIVQIILSKAETKEEKDGWNASQSGEFSSYNDRD